MHPEEELLQEAGLHKEGADNYVKGGIYTKDINNETITLVEEIRPGHSELAICTLYKRKKKLTDAKSPADSADSGFASFSKKKLTGAKS